MKSIFIIGPSGSGKSTLSQYLAQIYKCLFGQNSTILINLDPANPSSQYSKYNIDLNNLITIEDIMQEFQVGPNGAMLYAMDFLYQNKQWLQNTINQQINTLQPHYKIMKQANKQNIKAMQFQYLSPLILIFDLPGQIQLYLQNQSTKSIIKHIKQKITQNLCVLQLFDSTFIYQTNDFVSLCMMSLVTMINLQLPHLSILNKIDVIKGQRPALGMLNQYFDISSVKAIVQDLQFYSQTTEQKQNLARINQISSVLDQYNLVNFIPCSIYKIQLIKFLILQIEKIFNTHELNKYSNKKYMQFIKSVDKDYAKQEIITELENQLFQEQNQNQNNQNQQIQKVLKDIKAEIDKSSGIKQ